MTKQEVAKELRRKLTAAIKRLPDVEYQGVDVFSVITTQTERDHDKRIGYGLPDNEGIIHIIDFTAEEARSDTSAWRG